MKSPIIACGTEAIISLRRTCSKFSRGSAIDTIGSSSCNKQLQACHVVNVDVLFIAIAVHESLNNKYISSLLSLVVMPAR